VPGVTAGTALPALLGIPVTHRELARSVTFLTGHTKDGSEPDWKALVRSGSTLVVYMGLASLERIAASLGAAGMDPTTPACLIQDGSLKSQKVRLATLGTLAKDGFSTPALLVIGEVVRFEKENAMNTQVIAA
jgi:uroporphyrin-III C-methyltransferase